MKRMNISFFTCGLLTVLLSQYTILSAQSINQGEFWKEQALEKIMVPWTQHAIDQEYGAYHSYLERDWQPVNGKSKFPGMIARHLFSYAVAYMLSGEETYRQQAKQTYDYLIQKGWDQKYGGWYTELDRQGSVVDASKDMFMQTYAITGLAMYYLMTKDKEVKDYVDRSIELLETYAWDSTGGGGYVRALNRDLSVKNNDKVFSPQLAPVSGYLLYLYAATRETKYLQMSERILQTVMEKMHDAESGWILEAYDQNWQLLPEGNEWMNTGHNAEVAWMLLRLYELSGKESYLKSARELNERLLRSAFDPKSGIWYHKVKVTDATQHTHDSPWWVQAYGNMLQLYMYQSSGQLACLQHFRKGAEFWNANFVDPVYGGTYLSVGADGKIENGKKAVRTKTSYHSMEHGLLNYLYLDLWINQSEVQLYYFIEKADNDKLYPLPIEETDYEILQVQINGKDWQRINHQEGYVMLPGETDLQLMVKLRKK